MTASILYPTELSIVRCGSQLSLLEMLATRDRSFYRRIVVCPPGDEYRAVLEGIDVRTYVAGAHAHIWRFSPHSLPGTARDVLAAAHVTADVVSREDVRLIHAGSLVTALAAVYAKRLHPHLRVVLHERGLMYRWHTRALFRMVCREMDRIIVTTEFGRRTLTAYGVNPARLLVIPNGTDFHHRTPVVGRDHVRESLGIPQGARVIGIVANMARVKRIELFADVVARLGSDVHGVVVGGVLPILDGAPYEREVRERVQELGIAGRLVFAGQRDDVADVMRAMDVLVSTSSHESFGRTLIEAMAVGTPVVATATGAIPDLIRDGRTGLLVSDDPQIIAAALRRLLDDPSLAARLSAAALEEVRERYDAYAVSRRIEALYRELLNE